MVPYLKRVEFIEEIKVTNYFILSIIHLTLHQIYIKMFEMQRLYSTYSTTTMTMTPWGVI